MGCRDIVTGQEPSERMVLLARKLRRTMTLEEKLVWERLRGNRLKGLHFRRQQIIDRYIIDFYCDEVGLVVEIDGPGHAGQRERDAERTAALEALGLRVLRFSNHEVTANLDGVVAAIAAACRDRQT